VTTLQWSFNIMIVFVLSGFWHGSTFNFLIWGALHGLYYLATALFERFALRRQYISNFAAKYPNLIHVSGIFITFQLVAFAWIFFAADNLSHAFSIIQSAFVFGPIENQTLLVINVANLPACAIFLALLAAFEIFQEKGWLNWVMTSRLRWAGYYLLIMLVILFGVPNSQFTYGRF